MRLWKTQTPTGADCKCVIRANTLSEARAKVKVLFGLHRVPKDWRIHAMPASYRVHFPEREI